MAKRSLLLTSTATAWTTSQLAHQARTWGPKRGAVTILYGLVGAGSTSAGSTFWHQDSPGIADTIEEFDFFGSFLSH